MKSKTFYLRRKEQMRKTIMNNKLDIFYITLELIDIEYIKNMIQVKQKLLNDLTLLLF
jgi:hypothetical protein